ncbi:MAG TPA: MipA/OmpV family protein [Nitrospinota bacterium]|nr:MipA/OmpV family protein [Nitrospinota bacterium]
MRPSKFLNKRGIIAYSQFDAKATKLSKYDGRIRRIALVIIVITLFFSKGVVLANDVKRPLWDIGVISGFISWPHYKGSNQRYSLPIILPYFVYRGEHFRVNRKGIGGLLWSQAEFTIDLALSLNPPVKSNNNTVRSNMPDLPWSGEIGPRLLVLIYHSELAGKGVLRLPFKLVGNVHGKSIGWTFEPNVLITSTANSTGWRSYLNLGMLYGSKKYHDTYYGVQNSYQTDNRPAYSTSEGLHSFFATIGAKYRATNNFSMGFYVKTHFLDKGVVRDSPLVREKVSTSSGFWLAYVLGKSKQEASDYNTVSTSTEDSY